MVLPIALLSIGAIFIIAGFTNRSITDVINGTEPTNTDTDGLPNIPDITDPGSSGNVVQKQGIGDFATIPKSLLATKPMTIDGYLVAGWIGSIVLWARAHGWTGNVTSGIRNDAQQRQACIHVCGNPNGCPGTCAPPGQSNHRGSVFPLGAVDVSNPGQFAQVLKGYPGGAPIKNALPNDLVHFSRSGH